MNDNLIPTELLEYNDWANQKLLHWSTEVSDEELDRRRDIGFGTLRNTFYHVYAAEKLWLERWENADWRPLDKEAGNVSLADLAVQSAQLANRRNALLKAESTRSFNRSVSYKNSAGDSFDHPLLELIMHVINHGFHHRAQAINYMRHAGITIPGGIDYIFWKLAFPSCEQPSESLEPLRQYGLEVAEGTSSAPEFFKSILKRYFAYSDWATNKLLQISLALDSSDQDAEFPMGPGTIRKTLNHVMDSELWWLANWSDDDAVFLNSSDQALEETAKTLASSSLSRNQFLDSLNTDSANQIVSVTVGGPVTRFRVTESMIQLNTHATHHRAQILNMLRQLGKEVPALDYIVWLRETDG